MDNKTVENVKVINQLAAICSDKDKEIEELKQKIWKMQIKQKRYLAQIDFYQDLQQKGIR